MSSMNYRNPANVAFDFLYPIVGVARVFVRSGNVQNKEREECNRAIDKYVKSGDIEIIEGMINHFKNRRLNRTIYLTTSVACNTLVTSGLMNLLS